MPGFKLMFYVAKDAMSRYTVEKVSVISIIPLG